MKILIKILLLSAVAAILAGCASAPETTIIRDRRIAIAVPGIKDTLTARYEGVPAAVTPALDSVFALLPDTAAIVGSGDKIPHVSVKFYPVNKKFVFEVEPQTVDTTLRDTTNIYKKPAKETPKEATVAEKFGYAVYGIIGFLILGLGIFLCVKFKVFKLL